MEGRCGCLVIGGTRARTDTSSIFLEGSVTGSLGGAVVGNSQAVSAPVDIGDVDVPMLMRLERKPLTVQHRSYVLAASLRGTGLL